MRRRGGRVWLALALAAGCAAGCQDTAGQTYPADPLFANRKPIEAKAESTPPVAVACREPAAPPVPALVVAAARRESPIEPPRSEPVLAPLPGAE